MNILEKIKCFVAHNITKLVSWCVLFGVGIALVAVGFFAHGAPKLLAVAGVCDLAAGVIALLGSE